MSSKSGLCKKNQLIWLVGNVFGPFIRIGCAVQITERQLNLAEIQVNMRKSVKNKTICLQGT